MSRTLFFPLLLLAVNGYSQTNYQYKIDSLKRELSAVREDSTRAQVLIGMLTIYDYHKPEEGLTYRDSALNTAAKTKNKKYIAKVNEKIGRINWRLGKFNEAYKYHFTALDLYEELDDKPARNYVLVQIGQDYLNDVQFEKAGEFLKKALKLSQESNDKLNIVRSYNILIALYENLGNHTEASRAIYAQVKACEELGDKLYLSYAKSSLADYFQTTGNNVEALQYHKEALQLRQESGDLLSQTYSHRSIGDLYLAMGNFPGAENSYLTALKVADAMENRWIVLHVLYDGLGRVYRTQGNNDKALHYFLSAADELRPIASNHTLATVYSKIGTIYTDLRKYTLAQKYFDSSLALCRKLDTKVPLQDYYNGVHVLDSAMGNWKDAYRNYKQFAAIRDSTFNRETLRKMMMSQVQYDAEKKEAVTKAEQDKKDLQAQSALRRQRNIRNSVIAAAAVVLIFSAIFYLQRNKLAKEKRRSDALLADKELLLKEIHHRVKNNLEVVSSLLALQSAQIEDPHTREAMQEGQNRVHSIGIVHQKLYQGENHGAIEMKDYFTNLSESVLDSFGTNGRVRIDIDMNKTEVDIDTAVPLGLIVNELLTNSLKYAFPGNNKGSIQIKMERQNGGNLYLEVADNGIGKSGGIKGTGFGAQLISLLTRQLNGSFTEENNNGTRLLFNFHLPGK